MRLLLAAIKGEEHGVDSVRPAGALVRANGAETCGHAVLAVAASAERPAHGLRRAKTMTATRSALRELGLCVRTLANHYGPVMPASDANIVRCAVEAWPLMEAVVEIARARASGDGDPAELDERLAEALDALDAAVL